MRHTCCFEQDAAVVRTQLPEAAGRGQTGEARADDEPVRRRGIAQLRIGRSVGQDGVPARRAPVNRETLDLHAAGRLARRASIVIVEGLHRRDLSFAAGDVIAQRLVSTGIELRFFIVRQHALRLLQGTFGNLLTAVGNPLFDGVIVEQLGHEEGALEIGLRMRMAEIVPAGPDVQNRRQRLVEFVNANGELQVVDDREQLQAAAGCFGMLGVVTSITLALDPMTIANMRPQKIPAMLAVPPLPDTEVPEQLQIHPTQEQLDEAQARFVDAAANDFYAEWFWFAFQEKVWANTWKDDGNFEDAKDYPGPGAVFLQSAGTYIANILNQTVFRLLPGRWQAKFLTTTAMLVLPEVKDDEDPIATPVIDALHFQRGIQNMRVLDMEFEIPLPADGDGNPDWSVCQRAWWDVINLVYSLKRTPMRLTLEMRVMGGSNITMAPQFGNDLGTCSQSQPPILCSHYRNTTRDRLITQCGGHRGFSLSLVWGVEQAIKNSILQRALLERGTSL